LEEGDQASESQLQSDLRSKYDGKLVAGLNIPVNQALKLMEGKK
jgi:hypothetical protein